MSFTLISNQFSDLFTPAHPNQISVIQMCFQKILLKRKGLYYISMKVIRYFFVAFECQNIKVQFFFSNDELLINTCYKFDIMMERKKIMRNYSLTCYCCPQN